MLLNNHNHSAKRKRPINPVASFGFTSVVSATAPSSSLLVRSRSQDESLSSRMGSRKFFRSGRRSCCQWRESSASSRPMLCPTSDVRADTSSPAVAKRRCIWPVRRFLLTTDWPRCPKSTYTEPHRYGDVGGGGQVQGWGCYCCGQSRLVAPWAIYLHWCITSWWWSFVAFC